MTRLTIRFSLFRVPVSVHPSLWVMLLLLGGLLSVRTAEDLLHLLSFVIIAFLTLLLHEFGHALTGRALGGGCPSVTLAWLGGFCRNDEANLSSREDLVMTAAGPLFSLLPAGVTLLILLVSNLSFGGSIDPVLSAAAATVLGHPLDSSLLPEVARSVAFAAEQSLQIPLWWALINLLPIHPLDGGQILLHCTRSERSTRCVSFVTATTAAIVFLVCGCWFFALLAGLMALHHARVRRRPAR